jgi:two-component system, NtrC family, sensor kinase
MKSLLKLLLLLSLPFYAKAQQKESGSLLMELNNAADDTVRMVILKELVSYYTESNRDSAMFYVETAITIAKKIEQPLWIADLLLLKAYLFQKQENLSLSFKLCNEALAILQDKKNELNAYIPKDDEFAADPGKYRIALTINVFENLGTTYVNARNPDKGITYFREAIRVSESLNSRRGLVTSNMQIGALYSYAYKDKLDSSFIYCTRALENANLTGQKKSLGSILLRIANHYVRKEKLDSARHYYWQALSVNKEQNNLAYEADANFSLSRFYQNLLQTDSAMYYAIASFKASTKLKSAYRITAAASHISNIWKIQGNADSALAYLTLSKRVGDSLEQLRNNKIAQFQNTNFEEQLRLEKQAQESIAYKNKTRITALFIGLGLLAILAFIFYRINQQKQKANKVLESALTNLKSAQSQLIQSEKMASLGELTAGIAHEIQNPLNFVNNFSEVNKELIDEMQQELKVGKIDDAIEISNDIKANEEKINHHGKRADAIVKGMLQHSRSGSGKKEPTDINKLADEYLRLAYHGLRAKDKSFNATMKTDFDESIGNINIVPQDIGRVILNLITNAFYATNEKAKLDFDNYEPIVTVKTSKITHANGSNKVEISVADNGDGIPQKVVDKIFQPFFTTKPTGQGTGLGLSMSYDIVKAHGGELLVESRGKVETKEGEGSKFIISLPM